MLIDLTGKIFGSWTVISKSHKHNGYWQWKCQCSLCKKVLSVDGSSLRRRKSTSCGCHRNIQHGMTKTRTFKSWDSMKSRCYNSDDPNYLGIQVCDHWRNSFENFLKDMGERPKGMTLDRIDGKKNYTPDNCRWATAEQQIRNRRVTRRLTVFNYDRPIVEWAKDCKLPINVIAYRVAAGWSPEAAITTPNQKAHSHS